MSEALKDFFWEVLLRLVLLIILFVVGVAFGTLFVNFVEWSWHWPWQTDETGRFFIGVWFVAVCIFVATID